MPAKSKSQRELMVIAEHHPSQVNKANRGVLKMSHQQLHDFAATKGLKRQHIDKGHSSVVGANHGEKLRHG